MKATLTFRWLFYGFALSLLLAGVVLPVHAQRAISDDEVNAIAKDLFCPVCESTPLDVCPTQACADWRELIRTQLAEGKSRQEIIDYFANQYGDRVLAEPPRHGFALLLWLFPGIAVLAGGTLFVRFLRQTIRTESVSPPVAPSHQPLPEPSDDYLAQIEQELSQR